MKNLLRTLALVLCLSFVGQSEAFAQPFKSAVGLRLGSPWAASFKTFISESSALEVYVGYRGFLFYNQVGINGAYQLHNDIDGVDGLQWYYGAGAGVQFWNYSSEFIDNNIAVSASGYLGLQYTLEDTPLSLSVDWVPTFFLGDNALGSFNRFGYGYGALAARYVIGG